MHPRFVAAALLLIGVLVGSGGPAAADPIQITGGALDIRGTTGTLQISGDRGFTLSAGVTATDGVFQPWLQCVSGGCTPGTTIDLTAFFVGLSLRSATATLDGETFTGVGGVVSTTSASARFTGSVVAPFFTPDILDTAQLLAPFVFAGQFSYMTPAGRAMESLHGSGTVLLSLQHTPGRPSWAFTSARYELQPLPEPATLVLTGAGVLALGVRRFRRRPTA